MGWRAFVRTIERSQARAQRQAERAALRRRRELLAQAKTAGKLQEQQQAAHQAALFDNYIDVITTVHRDGWSRFDWATIARNPPPQPPSFAPRHEAIALQAASAYTPSLGDQLLGGAARRASELTANVDAARRRDAHDYQLDVEAYRSAYASWQWFGGVAAGVLRGDPAAYRAVIEHLAPFQDLLELGTTVTLQEVAPASATFLCSVQDREIVPTEELKLTASGKLTTKAMSQTRYWELYRDHVCGIALRVVRDAFAILPLERVTVNVAVPAVDPRTGHQRPSTLLALSVQRAAFAAINVETCDPYAASANFDRRIDFKARVGLREVEPFDSRHVFLSASYEAPRGR